MLLERDADVNLGTVDSSALLDASLIGHEGCVQLLLEKGAHVNVQHERNSTALLAASYRGFEDIVNTLLEKGANVNA
jgi:ankyrin repeat protein